MNELFNDNNTINPPQSDEMMVDNWKSKSYGWVYNDVECKKQVEKWGLTIEQLIEIFQRMDEYHSKVKYIQSCSGDSFREIEYYLHCLRRRNWNVEKKERD